MAFEVVLTNVPEHEFPVAESTMPDAARLADPFGPGTADAHPDARVLAVMIHDEVPPDLLGGLPQLQAVVTRSDGFDHLPLEWMDRNSIAGFHLEGYATHSVTQLALQKIIGLVRRVPEAGAQMRTGDWTRAPFVGRELRELTVGVLGVGRIGSAVSRAVLALGGTVVGHDLVKDPKMAAQERFSYVDGLEDFLAASDVVSLHVPLTDKTHHIMDATTLAMMPEDGFLVNTARGDVVDQDAVLDALASGHLAGYAADVLPGEPDPPHLESLLRHDNVQITPHLGAHNHATIRARYEQTARIVRAVLAGDLDAVDRFRVA